jgi:inhibitor of cysteine peptidase
VRVNLTQDDSGAARDLRLGDEITVVLDENPTTGYRWHADVDTARLQLTDDQYQGADRPIGASGVRRLTFAPLQAGPARLHLVKRRSWEQAVVAEFDIALDIAPK